MRFRFAPHAWLATVILVVACGCGGASSSASGAAGESLPTHQRASLGDAGVGGVLSGRPDCLWLEPDDGQPTALIFPSGTTTDPDGEDIVVLDDHGREIARTGQFVFVSGEGDPGTSSCLRASGTTDTTAPWLVAAVEQTCASETVNEDGGCP